MEWTNLYKVLNEYGEALRNKLQDEYIKDNKIASGELLNSCEYVVEYDERQISVSLDLASWWKYVEYGRQPGKFPPPDKILEWIRIKPIIPREGVNGKLPTEKQLSYLIGRKIALEGIDAGNYLQMSVKEINDTFNEKIEEAITKDVNDNLTVIFSEYFSK